MYIRCYILFIKSLHIDNFHVITVFEKRKPKILNEINTLKMKIKIIQPKNKLFFQIQITG